MEASELKEILEQHKLWIKTNGAEGKHANLTGANLEGANLEGANLEGAYLEGAYLWYANLTHANLTHANLTRASLYGANLYGANLEDADFTDADLTNANFTDADLTGARISGARISGASLTGAIGLPDISWIEPGILVQLNHIKYEFYLEKENKHENFIQDSLGFIIQNNSEEETFDMLVEDRIIRGIPDWVKYSGLKQIE